MTFLTLLLGSAFAIPLQVNQQGRLLDADGKGLTGDHELTFRLMDDPDDGYAQWEDTLNVSFVNGYYSVFLGADEENNPLDDAVFSQYPLFLELKVDGEALSPRQPVTSVPYAQMAGVAEVAESVDGGSVNASDISVNGNPVVNANGQWVGEAPTVDFMNLQNRPPGLDDGDDDTQLTQSEVVDYINGSQVILGAASQVDGSDIVTANSFAGYLPADLADGDADTLAGLNCATGEIASWDGNASWVCTSDATLEWTDVENMLVNNPVDLNAGTTIGGNAIITSVDDSDTLQSLSCGNGEVAKYDDSLMEWYCDIDIDTDTVLDQAGVLAHVNEEVLSLGSGTQVDGSDVVTVDTFASNLPADLADGDADTLAGLSCGAGEIPSWDGSTSWVCISDATLDETTVEGYITDEAINLYAGSQVDGNVILTTDSQLDFNKLDNVPSGLADGDDNTQLGQSEVVSYVEAGSVNLAQNSQVNSRNIVGQPSVCSNGQVLVYNSTSNDWICGDDTDTTLTPTEMQTMIEALSLNLQNVPQVNGENVLTTGSSINPTQLEGTGGSSGQVLTTDGTTVSWGDSSAGCELIANSSSNLLLQCNGHQFNLDFKLPFQDISYGADHICALYIDNSLQCWGRDDDNQVSNAPTGVFSKVESGSHHSCVLDTDGYIQCWGDNTYNQVSDAPTGGGFTALSSGGYSNCVLDSDGYIQCWGRDSFGQVSVVPTGVFNTVAVGEEHICAIDTVGSLQCWGDDRYGEVSNAPTVTFQSISIGRHHTCGIDSSGLLKCWGRDDYSQVSNTPSGVFSVVDSGTTHSCAIDSDQAIQCWGRSSYNQLNFPSGSFEKISTQFHDTCAINTAKRIQCWGNNNYGQHDEIPE